MISTLLDEASTKAGERYVNFLMSLRGVLGTSLSSRPDDMRAFEQIRAGAYSVAEVFLEQEEERFAMDLLSAQERAEELVQSDALGRYDGSAGALSDYSEELVVWFRQELRAQIERDVNTLVAKRRELILEAAVRSRSSRLDMMESYLELIRNGREKVDFYFKDRSGRRYPSQKFVRQLYRHGMLTVAVEVYALEAADMGFSELEIITRDSNNSYSGQRITLSAEPGMLKLSDVRDEVFHPNSNSFIKIVGGLTGG